MLAWNGEGLVICANLRRRDSIVAMNEVRLHSTLRWCLTYLILDSSTSIHVLIFEEGDVHTHGGRA